MIAKGRMAFGKCYAAHVTFVIVVAVVTAAKLLFTYIAEVISVAVKTDG